MKVIIQRVSQASVHIESKLHTAIAHGMLILVGISGNDTQEDADWLSRKIADLRIFPDEQGLMNKSIKDNSGDMLVVSQFTLHASYKKGNRPSFINAARPEHAIPLYEYFIKSLGNTLSKPVYTGVFGADMKVSLINDGPVTIIMDTQNKE